MRKCLGEHSFVRELHNFSSSYSIELALYLLTVIYYFPFTIIFYMRMIVKSVNYPMKFRGSTDLMFCLFIDATKFLLFLR